MSAHQIETPAALVRRLMRGALVRGDTSMARHKKNVNTFLAFLRFLCYSTISIGESPCPSVRGSHRRKSGRFRQQSRHLAKKNRWSSVGRVRTVSVGLRSTLPHQTSRYLDRPPKPKIELGVRSEARLRQADLQRATERVVSFVVLAQPSPAGRDAFHKQHSTLTYLGGEDA